MLKRAAMPIYGKNPSKISGTGGPISTKHDMKHRWLKYSNVYITHGPVMTLTYTKVNLGRLSMWIGKTVKMSFIGKILQEMSSKTEY